MSSDPYVYPGTTILKNIPGIRNQERLDRFEADRVGQRSLELIECPLSGLFDLAHLKGIRASALTRRTPDRLREFGLRALQPPLFKRCSA